MTARYEKLFTTLADRNEGAFVPFIMLGDPSPAEALDIVRAVVSAGADALELGVPFSDPVADGPTIQASHIRALAGGATVDSAIEQIRTIRAEFPDVPIGMLIYGNVPFTRGLDTFYSEFAAAGADSILLPDVPVREGAPSSPPPRLRVSTPSSSLRHAPQSAPWKAWLIARRATSMPSLVTA